LPAARPTGARSASSSTACPRAAPSPLDADGARSGDSTSYRSSILRQRWVVVDHGREIRAIVEGAVAGGVRIKVD